MRSFGSISFSATRGGFAEKFPKRKVRSVSFPFTARDGLSANVHYFTMICLQEFYGLYHTCSSTGAGGVSRKDTSLEAVNWTQPLQQYRILTGLPLSNHIHVYLIKYHDNNDQSDCGNN